MKRRTALKILGSALGSFVAPALAQTSGRQPVRIIVPYAPGGQTDTMARLLADSMRKRLGRVVIVENRPGAAALIATTYVQMAPPDGDTLLFHNSGLVALPMLSKAATYDPVVDFDAVAMVGTSPNFLMVVDTLPVRSIPEFLAYAKANPGIECANSGTNSGGHISAMLLEKLAGISLTHVPYKGSSEVTLALMRGEVKMQVSVTTEALNPQIESGKIRVLGVATKERSALAPHVPPIADFVPEYAIDGWFGLLTSAKAPLDKRETMAEAIRGSLQEPEIREKFAALFMDVSYRGPKEFAQAILQSKTFLTNVVRQLELSRI